MPDTRRPTQRWKAIPPGRPPTNPTAGSSPKGMQAKGTVLGPNTRTPAPTARGQQTLTARREDGQPGGDERLTSDAPHNGARHIAGDALPPPPQRPTPACKSARCGAGAGSPMPTPPVPGTHPRDGRPGEGQRLTPDAPHNGGRQPPPGRPPTIPAARSPPEGMQAKGTVPGPHARTPVPTARGQRTPTARPEDGEPGEDKRLTSVAPRNGARHPPPGTPSCHPHNAQCRLARAHAVRPVLGPPCPHHPCPGHTGNGSCPQGWAAGRETVPDTTRHSQQCEVTPPRCNTLRRQEKHDDNCADKENQEL